MNDIIKFENNEIDIIKNPENYPVETVGIVYLKIKKLNSNIYETQKKLEHFIFNNMIADNATKMILKENNNNIEFNIVNGKVAFKDGIDVELAMNGFDPNKYGKFEYIPSWTKIKEARKLGGELKEIIDEFIIDCEKKLSISKKNA